MTTDSDCSKPTVRSRKREVLKGPGVFPVEIEIAGHKEGLDGFWLENRITVGTASVVEGSLERIVRTSDEGQSPIVWVAIPSSEVLEIQEGEEPWFVREMSNEDRESVKLCKEMTAERSRSEWYQSGESKGLFTNSCEEKVMVVNLVDKCPHPVSKMKEVSCGHPYCEICDGNVHPISKVVLKSAGPVITCNRAPASTYEFVFRENFAGSEHLTTAMRKSFGKQVDEATDIIKGAQYDLREKWVYEREKKRMKSRCTLIDHWSPNCRTASRANRKPYRWKDEPYGHVQDEKLMDDSVLMVRTAKLAMIKHMVGDFFGIEHIYPTPMLEMDCYKELLALPGVFVLTWDNCMYGQDYVHRQ